MWETTTHNKRKWRIQSQNIGVVIDGLNNAKNEDVHDAYDQIMKTVLLQEAFNFSISGLRRFATFDIL